MRFNHIILLLGCWLSVSLSLAQDISVPFFCGFEDAVEMSHWTLNDYTPTAADQWCVGTATRSEGRQCLYISNDSAQSAKHGISNNVVLAYRTIKFPEKTAKYNISFDWKNQGGVDDRTRLYVWIGPKTLLQTGFYTDKKGKSYGLKDMMSSTTGTPANWPSVVGKFYKLSDGTQTWDYLANSQKWQNVFIKGDGAKPDVSLNISKSVAKNEFVLAFIWVNTSNVGDAETLSACVDNVQIASAELKRPSNFQADMHCEDSNVVLTWETALPFHDIEYRKSGEEGWRIISSISATQGINQRFSFKLKQEGSYDFRVRGYNAARTDTSAYASVNNFVFWCVENHIINYIDLGSEKAICRYADESKTWPVIPVDFIGVIDDGEESMRSRHTVNWIENRYDPFTIGSVNYEGKVVEPLHTIPEGYLASVRLGNWDSGAERESITYTFVVDSTTQSILIMKYAILFEDPGHENDLNFFNLVVLNAAGQRVDPDCGEVNFKFSDARAWNVAKDAVYGGKKIPRLYWKDWSSVGLNLSEYHGDTLSVCITTADCGAGAHATWAYFVLDCVSAKLETDNCGASSMISVSAPDGFNYTWTDSRGNVLGHDQQLIASANRETYTCEACMTELSATGSSCCFELSTVFEPRFPAPDYSYEWIPENCKNIIQFHNKSHVMTMRNGEEVHTDEECEIATWNFMLSSGLKTTTEETPKLECNPAGDTIVFTLSATLGGGMCDSVIEAVVYVPSIITSDSIINAQLCEGESFIFAGQAYKESGVYYDTKTNFAGCDSTAILNLTVHQKSPQQYTADTICSSDLPYTFNGFSYIYSGTYTQDFKNQWDCDSLVTLSLHVLDKLEVDVSQLPTLCADDEQLVIDYAVMSGLYDSVAIRFYSSAPQTAFYNQMIYDQTQTTVVYPYDDSILPDHYRVQLEFYQHAACGNQIFDLDFDLQYRSSIIEQKWNDVLALLNNKYNGGYTFSAYQWYKDGLPIPGATKSYLYQELDMDAQYSVELTREDGVVIQTCPFQPTPHTDTYMFPTLVQTQQKIPVRRTEENKDIVRINIYTMLGQKYSTTAISQGEGYVTMPAACGNYLVEIVYQGDESRTQHLVVIQ